MSELPETNIVKISVSAPAHCQNTVTISRAEYLTMSLALGVAAQILEIETGVDKKHWGQTISQMAVSQLNTMSAEEVDKTISIRQNHA